MTMDQIRVRSLYNQGTVKFRSAFFSVTDSVLFMQFPIFVIHVSHSNILYDFHYSIINPCICVCN